MKLTNAKDITQLTEERREKYAGEIFKYQTVMESIVKAASKGQGYIRISQNLSASLKNKKATRQLIKHLKDAGYNIEWVDAVERERSNGAETGGFIQYEEMRISWCNVRIHSGPQSIDAS